MQLRPRRHLGLVIVGLVIGGLRHPVPSWRWLLFGCVWSVAVGVGVAVGLHMLLPPRSKPTATGES